MSVEPITVVAAALLATLSVGGAFIDALTLRIPNWLCLAIVGAFPVLVVAQGPSWAHLGAIAVGLCMLGLGAALFARGWIGGGDAKMVAAVSLWAGPELLMPTMFVITLAGGVLAIIATTPVWTILRWVTAPFTGAATFGPSGKIELPYGVAIAFGALFIAQRIVHFNLL